MWQKIYDQIRERAPIGVFLLIALLTILLWLRYVPNPVERGGVIPQDFSSYYEAIQVVRQGGDPYSQQDLKRVQHSPGAISLGFWLPRSLNLAWEYFSAIIILIFSLSVFWAQRYPTWTKFFLLILGYMLAWKGILETLAYGQTELLIFSFILIAARFLDRRPWVSGFLVGMLPWLKITWVLVTLPFILRCTQTRKRGSWQLPKFLFGYLLGTMFLGSALPSLLMGPDRALLLSQKWILHLYNRPDGFYMNQINQSLWMFIGRTLSGIAPMTLIVGIGGILGGLLLGRLVARSSEATSVGANAMAWMSPWVLLIQLLNPLAWRWGSVFALGVPMTVHFRGRKHWFQLSLQVIVILMLAVLWLAQFVPVLSHIPNVNLKEIYEYGFVSLYWFCLLLLCL